MEECSYQSRDPQQMLYRHSRLPKRNRNSSPCSHPASHLAIQKQQVTSPNSFLPAALLSLRSLRKDPREPYQMEPHRPGCPRPAPRTAADLATRPEGGAITAAQRAARAAMAAGRLPAVLLLLALLLGGTAGPGARAARSRGAEKQNSFRRAASGLYQGVSGLFGEDNVRALQKVRPLLPAPTRAPRAASPFPAVRRPRGASHGERPQGAELGAGPGRTAGTWLWGGEARGVTAARRRPVKPFRRQPAGALRPGCGACCALWVRWGRKRC